jgi:hypothetical protein
MSEFDPERIVMQAASTDADTRTIEALVREALKIVHAKESDLHISSAEQVLGWNFYMLSIGRDVMRRLAQLPESNILRVKGDSFEQKFVNWLNKQAKKKDVGDRAHFILLSDLKSSRYGLF